MNDFYIGAKGEALAIMLLEKAGFRCEKSKGKNELWDIKATQGLQCIYLEVKNDQMSRVTGNLAIEYFNPKSGKPSGIMATISDFWIICFGEPLEAWMCDVSLLKEYLNDNRPFKIIDVGGDKNASLMLYKKEKLLETFYRIDNMDSSELESCIKFYISDRAKAYLDKEIGENNV